MPKGPLSYFRFGERALLYWDGLGRGRAEQRSRGQTQGARTRRSVGPGRGLRIVKDGVNRGKTNLSPGRDLEVHHEGGRVTPKEGNGARLETMGGVTTSTEESDLTV